MEKDPDYYGRQLCSGETKWGIKVIGFAFCCPHHKLDFLCLLKRSIALCPGSLHCGFQNWHQKMEVGYLLWKGTMYKIGSFLRALLYRLTKGLKRSRKTW